MNTKVVIKDDDGAITGRCDLCFERRAKVCCVERERYYMRGLHMMGRWETAALAHGSGKTERRCIASLSDAS
jgi:hypothetical protein